MTEYEIADLALSTQEGIRQQVGLVQEQDGLYGHKELPPCGEITLTSNILGGP
jgi:hypothetical protein